jgi:hypothetical protein
LKELEAREQATVRAITKGLEGHFSHLNNVDVDPESGSIEFEIEVGKSGKITRQFKVTVEQIGETKV